MRVIIELGVCQDQSRQINDLPGGRGFGEGQADLKSVDVGTVLNTYNVELYRSFRAAGYDPTERHEMGAILVHGTRNRPLQLVS